jgi:sulfonate transport system substrate-binding protein
LTLCRGIRTVARWLAAGAVGAVLTGLPFSPSAADEFDLSKVTLRIGDQTGATQSRLRAAGVLEGVPYKIEWSVYAAAVNLHEALKAGAIDLGAAGDAPTVSAFASRSPIRIVAAWSNGGRGTDLLVPHDSPIQSVADLRGRTVSPTTRGSIGHFLVVGALKKTGLTPADVKLAFLTPNDASAAFVAGSIDAWSIWGVYRSRAVGALKARVLAAGRDNLPGLGVIIATQSALADPAKVAAIADYAHRVERGYRWSLSHRDELMAWYMSFAKQDKATAALIYDDEVNYIRVPIDDRLVASLQDTYAIWVEAGVFRGNLDLNQYVYRDLKSEFLSDGGTAAPSPSRE